MVHPLLESALVQVAHPRRGNEATTPDPSGPQRMIGGPYRVAGLGVVAPHTSVLLWNDAGDVELRAPGSVLGPALRPSSAPTYLVVNHRPVSLDLVLGPLPTIDGRELETVVLRLLVQVADPPTGLVELAQEYGAALEEVLLDRLAAEVSDRVRTAVRLNRLSELGRRGVSAILTSGWLADSYLDGLIVREGLQVTDVGWPTQAAPDPSYEPRRRADPEPKYSPKRALVPRRAR